MSVLAQRLDLEAAASGLVTRLGGVWRPSGTMCRCPAHNDRTPSLSVRVGDSSLLFKCFAGCNGVEILRAIRRLNFEVPVSPASGSTGASDRDAAMAERARMLWGEALPIGDTPADAYLASRGILNLSPALRFHPRTPLGRGRAVRFRPALIAAIEERSLVVAVQRIFLERGAARLARDLTKPKLALGRPLSGAVRLHRAGKCLGIAEGVETAESAAALLGIPVWATLGAERLARIGIPDFVERLILLPDNDRAGRLAEQQARIAYARADRTIETVWPWYRLNDWNRVLLREGKGVGDRVRLAA
ncbi:virulence-associated protein E [Sphingomonas psychrotolerans]|uniref:Virulence-associated protein E n=2 Tax=Sphingomonas psychrotolerans TaxID=1327635 RepID=A0A2K8MQW2_9SPHN|nr:virulence-associated protein E [Sphingomonas psychrotolerans]